MTTYGNINDLSASINLPDDSNVDEDKNFVFVTKFFDSINHENIDRTIFSFLKNDESKNLSQKSIKYLEGLLEFYPNYFFNWLKIKEYPTLSDWAVIGFQNVICDDDNEFFKKFYLYLLSVDENFDLYISEYENFDLYISEDENFDSYISEDENFNLTNNRLRKNRHNQKKKEYMGSRINFVLKSFRLQTRKISDKTSIMSFDERGDVKIRRLNILKQKKKKIAKLLRICRNKYDDYFN